VGLATFSKNFEFAPRDGFLFYNTSSEQVGDTDR